MCLARRMTAPEERFKLIFTKIDLTELTVRENIMTGLHFPGCKSCGTYDRHNQVAQVALAYLRNELKFTGSTSSVDSNFVGHSADGKSKHTDGHVWGMWS